MIFELRSLGDDGRIRGVARYDDEKTAWSVYQNAATHAAEHGGCFELLRDDVRIAYVYREPPRVFSVAPDGTTEVKEPPLE